MVQTKSEEFLLWAVRIAWRGVLLDAIYHTPELKIIARPPKRQILDKDSRLLVTMTLSRMSGWKFATFRSLNISDDVRQGCVTIDDQKLFEELLGIQLSTHAVAKQK